MGCLSWLCFWRRENLQEDEVIFPSVNSPSTSENVSATDILPPEAFVSQQSYEPLASPRSPLIRSRGELTPPDTPVIPPAKRLKPDEKYVDFPFLWDDNTVDYIRRSKLMIILKGLPGSGKSTLAENIKKVYENAVVCSADHFFMVDGQYNFNPQKLKDAHSACQKKAMQAAKRNFLVVIDNTNIKNWESSNYIKMCRKYHYVAIIVEPQTPWRFDVQELVRKTFHGVKEEIIARKLNDYQAAHPIYYAWFLNEPDSLKVSKIAWQWLEKALLEIEDFFQDFSQITKFDSIDDILQYFANENIILHTTSKFTGRGKQYGSLEYINDPKVKCALGQCFPLNIIGFVITPRTFGARIKLTDEQLELWGSNDYETPPDNLMRLPEPEFVNKKEPYTTTGAHGDDDDDEDEEVDNDNLVDSCEPKIIITPQETGKNRFWPTSGKGSRAHITLGCAWGVKPVTTGFDLIDVISCEHIEEDSKNTMDVDSEDSGYKTYNFYGAVMKCYGKGRWVIYPEDKIIVESLFSAFY